MDSGAWKLRRVMPGASADFDALMRIYSESHPRNERKSVTALAGMIERPEYFFSVIGGESVLGFSIAIAFRGSDAGLLEYMAVDNEHRNCGIGQTLFRETMDFPGLKNRVILIEVDSDYEVTADRHERSRRKAFYRRLGCREVEGLSYRMPQVAESQPQAMELMIHGRSLPASIERGRLKGWLGECYSQVYQLPRDDRRIEEMIAGLPERVRLV